MAIKAKPEGSGSLDCEICVVGIWHLGSVVSACLADMGYKVTGIDKDAERVKRLNSGRAPLYEPGLDELIRKNLDAGSLKFTTSERCVALSRYVLIAFDTPVNEQDEVDISEILSGCRSFSEHLQDGTVIVVSSQVPVGTCDEIKSVVRSCNKRVDFDVAYSPENLRLGEAIECYRNPERIVIGADSKATLDKVEQMFKVIPAPKHRMRLRSAEMTKHALNAYLATCISFINEIANLCDLVGADAIDVANAVRSDRRVGRAAPLRPGLGFAGGHLARDLKILKGVGKTLGYKTAMIDSVLKVNEGQTRSIAARLEKILGSLQASSIGVLGLTYKPGTSTLHRSAALQIIGDLVEKGAFVKAHDPKASREEIQVHTEFRFCEDPYEVAEGSDALVVVTEWPEYRDLDFAMIKAKMKRPILLDTRNALDPKLVTRGGLMYYGIGTRCLGPQDIPDSVGEANAPV